MIPSLSSVLSSVTGKVVAGVVVATTSVGAAAAAGVEMPVTVPFVEEAPAADEPVATCDDDVVDADDESGDDTSVDATCERDDTSGDDESGDDESGDDESGDDESGDDTSDDSDADENHGEVVSDFVHSTDLEGCAKGQATAAVARGDVNPGDYETDEELAAALDEFTAKCDRDDDSDDDADDADDADEESDGDENHGEVVSDFVHSTDLEGCAKGQATAAVARGDVKPGDHETDEELAAALDEFTAKCDRDPDSADADDADHDADDDVESNGKSEGKSNGKSEGKSNGKSEGKSNGKGGKDK